MMTLLEAKLDAISDESKEDFLDRYKKALRHMKHQATVVQSQFKSAATRESLKI